MDNVEKVINYTRKQERDFLKDAILVYRDNYQELWDDVQRQIFDDLMDRMA